MDALGRVLVQNRPGQGWASATEPWSRRRRWARPRRMETSAKATRKRPRRRRAGPHAGTTVRLPRQMRERIDRWQREHGAKTRSDAVYRLLKQALGTDPGRRISRKFAAKASDLAGRVLDRMTDPSATTEEQAKRKRRLIKGPRELRTTGRKF